jgi:uncharacterized protein (UPF0333 family)
MKFSLFFIFLLIFASSFAQTDMETEATKIFQQAIVPGKKSVRNIGAATENIYTNIKTFEKRENRHGEPVQNIDGQETTFLYKIGSKKETTLMVSYNITFYGQEMLISVQNSDIALLEKVKELSLAYMAENFEAQENPMKFTMEPYYIEVQNVVSSYFESGQFLFSVMVYKNL